MNEQILLFELGSNNFFLPATSIVQVQGNLSTNYIANGLPYLSLVTSIRGDILPIIDLRIFLEMNITEKLNNLDKEKFITIESNKNTIILKVDKVLEIIDKPIFNNLTNLHQINTNSNTNYYSFAFLHMNRVFIGINLLKIIKTVENDFKHLYSDFISKNLLNYYQIKIAEKELDVYIEEKMVIQPSTRLNESFPKSMTKYEKKHLNGTLIKVNSLNIIVPNNDMIEIFSTDKITKVPNTLNFILGVINYRSMIVSVIDLSIIFGFKKNNLKNIKKLLIVKLNNDLYALRVDSVIKNYYYKKSSIRNIFTLNSMENNYFFKSAIIDITGEIFFLLNLDYILRKLLSFNIYMDQKFNDIIFFSNPKERKIPFHSLADKNYILIKNSTNLFLLNSSKIDQILDKNSILIINYNNQVVRGAAAHNNIIPLVDFNYALNKEKMDLDSDHLTGIVVNSLNNGEKICFLVEEILDYLSIDDIRFYGKNIVISNQIFPSIYSALCTYKENIGTVIDVDELFNETIQNVISALELKDISEFETTLSLSEKSKLQKITQSKKELETFLSKFYYENRFEIFVFRLNKHLIGLEVDNVRRVYSSLDLEKFKENYSPIVGLVEFESNKILILDLNVLIMSGTENVVLSEEKLFFSLEIANDTYLIQTDDIFGVYTIFKKDLNEIENISIFKGIEKTSRYSSKSKILPNSVRIIKNNELQTMIDKTNLKEIKLKINVNED